jgi:class 3 adenylate cyclase
MKSSKETELGGKMKEATVLFSDIRSYTTLSEGMSPDEVMSLLNEYHERVSKVIVLNKGSIFYYAGDGMLAVFGAPDHVEDHPSCALKAAIEMQEATDRMNLEFSGSQVPPIKVGIGICTGIIAYGVMGRDSLKNYTAIGDVVNTSSRLQGLSEQYNSKIIIAESTVSKLKGQFDLTDLGEVYVKGKTEPIKIFGISSR